MCALGCSLACGVGVGATRLLWPCAPHPQMDSAVAALQKQLQEANEERTALASRYGIRVVSREQAERLAAEQAARARSGSAGAGGGAGGGGAGAGAGSGGGGILA